MIGADEPVAVSNVLVFTISRGNAEELLPRTARTRAGNVIAAVGILDSQDVQRDRIDVGPVAGNLHGT